MESFRAGLALAASNAVVCAFVFTGISQVIASSSWIDQRPFASCLLILSAMSIAASALFSINLAVVSFNGIRAIERQSTGKADSAVTPAASVEKKDSEIQNLRNKLGAHNDRSIVLGVTAAVFFFFALFVGLFEKHKLYIENRDAHLDPRVMTLFLPMSDGTCLSVFRRQDVYVINSIQGACPSR